ncbi:MAG: YggS family pyridoxal phosphate-dependent enzyme [Halobacteriovoraceae bacterium]|nr:YggS family pyridoxal phosphate-dependent enzyme [Halobacteriovoraceae bacterium]MBC99441.1 YggS family pyridoxal phosphate-dependent enzyme [Halobacteriovoraceae bacterium]|tara:strand:+ start:33598 stop:34338 length:741 start_codon:yes stop_codon:yes gene_type:complete
MPSKLERKNEIQQRMFEIESHYPSGHRPTLVHVTKTQPVDDIFCAYELGVRHFGENRVDELREKASECWDKGIRDIHWHFIGNLQSNKINRLFQVRGLSYIHSVDSFKLLKSLIERVDNLPDDSRGPVNLFIQVNTSNESEKSGLTDWDELMAMANYYSGLKNDLHPALSKMQWLGLMTMSKLRTDDFAKDARKCFSRLIDIRDTLDRDFDLHDLELSMGMSNDFQIALEMRSDYLRLGSLIYKNS